MVGEKLEQMEDHTSPISEEKEDSRQGGPVLSTGSTLLNLACAGRTEVGLIPGKFHLLVGDASAGKTFLAMTCLAEACRDPQFDNYRLIYDNIEDGCLLDLRQLFGEGLEKRIEPPAVEEGDPIYSETVEDFYFYMDDLLSGPRPVIYVLDSMDALTSQEEDTGFLKRKKAVRTKQEVSGSYGVGKARRNSEGLRRVLKGLRATNSILIILCQTRDDLGPGYAQKTRAGGRALRFYATLEIWASIKSTLKKNIRGKDRPIGVSVLWKVKKNRVIGALHEVSFNIYPSYGIDDLGSCVDFLVSEGYWKMNGHKIAAGELNLCLSREKLIVAIEKGGLSHQLRRLVGERWDEIESEGRIRRQNRYSVAPD